MSVLENYEVHALEDMSYDVSSYNTWIINHSCELYQHLIFIAVLESYLPNYVEHWSEEVLNFTKPVVTTNLKKQCKNLRRDVSIEKFMMEPQMGADFSDYRIDEFEKALKNEIKKGERMLKDETQKRKWNIIKKELEVIKEVLPIVGEFVEPNRERFINFYSEFKSAAVNQDTYELEDAINNFVNDVPVFHED